MALKLTRRQEEVAMLIAEGLESPAIAAILFISNDTVRKHVKRLLAVTKSKTRAEAINTLWVNGNFTRKS